MPRTLTTTDRRVFVQRDGPHCGEPISSNAVSAAAVRACRRADIEPPLPGAYVFCHAMESRMVRRGVRPGLRGVPHHFPRVGPGPALGSHEPSSPGATACPSPSVTGTGKAHPGSLDAVLPACHRTRAAVSHPRSRGRLTDPGPPSDGTLVGSSRVSEPLCAYPYGFGPIVTPLPQRIGLGMQGMAPAATPNRLFAHHDRPSHIRPATRRSNVRPEHRCGAAMSRRRD